MGPRTRTPAQVYEEFFVPALFAPCASLLLEAVPLSPGENVLDLACGSGVVARMAATMVGRHGRVVGIDLRQGMIDVATSIPSAIPIDWRVGDAQELDFDDDEFDIVLCQQGLQFFSQPGKALDEMRRVLRSGGRVGFAIWQGLDRNQFFDALTKVEANHLAPLGLTFRELAAPFLLGDPYEIQSMLTRSGFSDVEIEERNLEARFPADDFVENVEFGYSAVIPEFSESPSAFTAFVEAVERDFEPVLDQHREDGRINISMGVHLVRAFN